MPPKRKAKAIGSASNPRTSRTNSGNASAPLPILLSGDDNGNENNHHHKAALDSDDDIDEPVSSKRPAKKARKAQTKARGSGDAVARGAGPGGKAKKPSPTVEQHLLEQNAKSKEFVQGFREDVLAERERGWGVLGGMKKGLDKTAPVLTQKQQAVDYDKLKTVPLSADKEENPLYQQTQRMLRLCRSMIHRHRALERETERPDLTTPRKAWKEDEEEMGRLLMYGRQYGERLVGRLISPGGGDVGDKDGVGREMGGVVTELFKRERKTETWGRIAHAQEKALIEVVRTLAGNEAEK